MIIIQESNAPGYSIYNLKYYGTIHHSQHGVAASVNYDYKSTWPVRRYLCGLEPPNFPMPALIQDSQSNLGLRWSNWLDVDQSFGIRY